MSLFSSLRAKETFISITGWLFFYVIHSFFGSLSRAWILEAEHSEMFISRHCDSAFSCSIRAISSFLSRKEMDRLVSGMRVGHGREISTGNMPHKIQSQRKNGAHRSVQSFSPEYLSFCSADGMYVRRNLSMVWWSTMWDYFCVRSTSRWIRKTDTISFLSTQLFRSWCKRFNLASHIWIGGYKHSTDKLNSQSGPFYFERNAQSLSKNLGFMRWGVLIFKWKFEKISWTKIETEEKFESLLEWNWEEDMEILLWEESESM